MSKWQSPREMLLESRGRWLLARSLVALLALLGALDVIKLLLTGLCKKDGGGKWIKLAPWSVGTRQGVTGDSVQPSASVVDDATLLSRLDELERSVLEHDSRLGRRMDDPKLVEWIRSKSYFMWKPSQKSYNLSSTNRETSMGQAQIIQTLFKNKTGGFFVECGALDGETRSNTLTLERTFNWTGVLIEGDPTSLDELRSKRRHAHIVPHCLSTRNRTMGASFLAKGHVGRLIGRDGQVDGAGVGAGLVRDVLCLPLYSVLLALNRTHVDYFSLDVEGSEMDVLKTIPFDKVQVTALSVEFIHLGRTMTSNSSSTSLVSELCSFMDRQGYEVRARVTNKKGMANDIIFVKKGFNKHVKLFDIAT